MTKPNLNYLLAFVAITLVEIFIALYVRDRFVRPYVGDMLVVVVIYCFLRIFLKPYRLLPLLVFLFAAGVEFAQYFDFVTLLGLQDNRILVVALGSTFDVADLGCYAVGCIAMWLSQRWECRKCTDIKISQR